MKHKIGNGRAMSARGVIAGSGAALGVAAYLFLGGPAAVEARDKATPDETKTEAAAETEPQGQSGATTIVVSLKNQDVHVWRGDRKIDSSRVSSGRRGYATPAGIFSVLQKNKWHRSNIYSGAPMPYMQRLTWSGVALHAGVLPGYPASHGCIRLSTAFAKKLWGMTNMGHHIVVSHGAAPEPVKIDHPTLFQPSEAAETAEAEEKPAENAVVEPITVNEIARSADASDASKSEDAGSGGKGGPASQVIRVAARAGDGVAVDSGAPAAEEVSASTSPLRILITQRTGREKLRDVQKMLHDMGYTDSVPDGVMGPDTVKAIKVFEVHKGMPETGEFNDALIERMYVAADRGKPASGHLYVRQDMKPVFDAPVEIGGEGELGNHLFQSALYKPEDEKVDWVAITPDGGPAARDVLGRITVPAEVRQQVAALMQPGSSIVVSDGGISNETTPKGTDFVALIPRPQNAAAVASGQSDVEPEAQPARRTQRRRVQRRRVQQQPYYAHQGGFFGGRTQYYERPRYQRRPARRAAPRNYRDYYGGW